MVPPGICSGRDIVSWRLSPAPMHLTNAVERLKVFTRALEEARSSSSLSAFRKRASIAKADMRRPCVFYECCHVLPQFFDLTSGTNPPRNLLNSDTLAFLT